MHFSLDKRKIALVFTCIAISSVTLGQNQLWSDFIFNVPFANSYVFDTEASFKTLLEEQNKWSSVDITPDIERAVTQHIDVMFSVGAAFTHQKEGYNTIEVKPQLGMRYTFTPNSRILLRGLLRVEQRNLYYEENSSWQHSTRTRFRAESIIPINRKSYFEDRLWYGLLDAEVYWVLDKQLNERFANQHRYRLGIGYRSSYTWRYEIIYESQFTRDNIDGGFEQTSNVFHIIIKHFINKAKPAKVTPDN